MDSLSNPSYKPRGTVLSKITYRAISMELTIPSLKRNIYTFNKGN